MDPREASVDHWKRMFLNCPGKPEKPPEWRSEFFYEHATINNIHSSRSSGVLGSKD